LADPLRTFDLAPFLCDPRCHPSAHGVDPLLEVPHAGLARVSRDDPVERIIEDLDVAGLEAVGIDRLRYEVSPRDLSLLLRRVPGQPNDLATIAERTGDVLEDVRRRDEEHLAQVEGKTEIVVPEGRVLLGIEHLEERGCGIAVEARRELVDLVEHEHRIPRSGATDALDDVSWEGADIRPSMS